MNWLTASYSLVYRFIGEAAMWILAISELLIYYLSPPHPLGALWDRGYAEVTLILNYLTLLRIVKEFKTLQLPGTSR